MENLENLEKKIDDFINSLPCKSDMPFPPIKVEKPNEEYANLLLNAFSSSADSEIQAIAQYIYHSKTIEIKEVKNALMCTALVEMSHLDALSEIISLLGAKPFYFNSNNYFWSTGNIAYVDRSNAGKKHEDTSEKKNIRLKLENDINGEKNAIDGYKLLLTNILDKYIEQVILKIISDEQTHIKIFEYLIDKYL